jgi:hypothetical protein
MGVVIEICAKYPGGPTRITVTDIIYYTVYRNTQVYQPPSFKNGPGVFRTSATLIQEEPWAMGMRGIWGGELR